METVLNPWPWYISGPLIALVMALLLYLGKTFGMSSNLRTMCTIVGGAKLSDFFKLRVKDYLWNLTVLVGAIIGGFVAVNFLSNTKPIDLNSKTISDLQEMGFQTPADALMPKELFGIEAITSLKGLTILILGGILIGFGSRYAGGCTSGHAITGLSSLQKPSLIAVIGFFIGGLIMVHVLFPIIF